MDIRNVKSENQKLSLYETGKNITVTNSTEHAAGKKPHNSHKKHATNTIFAGNLSLNQDTITDKKLQSQKQAMKAILDKFNQDHSIDQGLETRREHQKELSADMKLAADQISNISKMKQEAKEAYGITDDSEEQKSLELLEKSMFTTEELTEEEMKQLEAMGPLTEYQKTALRYDAMEEIWKQRVEEAQNGITSETRTITAINVARLKTHPMVDAQKEAAAIIEEASKEVIGIIVQQTKENVDEEQEKKIEEAQKQQEAADQAKDKKSNPVEEEILQEQLLMDLKSIADKQKMLEEDIKGIVVDEQV
jgi:hypothetical protein